MKRFSQTQLAMYARCPEQYRRRYVLGHRIPPGVALIRGTAVDEAVSSAYRQKRDGKTPALDFLLDLAAQRVEEGFRGEIRLLPEEATIGAEKLRSRTIDTAVRLSKCHYKAVLPEVQPDLIQPKTLITLDDIDVQLVGYLDVVEVNGTIRDTKTTSKTPAADAADRSEQLAWYALGYRAATGKESPRQVLDYLIDTRRGAKYERRETYVPASDQERLLARIRATMQAIRAGVFPPTNPDTWWCSPRWCGYYETCPYVRRGATVTVPGNQKGGR